MYYKCAFRQCKNSSDNKNYRFHNFRRHDYNKWGEVCGLDMKNKKVTHILRNLYVCSEHFTREDYKMILSPFKGRANLRHEALPKPKGEIFQVSNVSSSPFIIGLSQI